MARQGSIQSFREFIDSISSARYDEFRARPEAKVENGDAFEQMRQHALDLYRGVEVPHTFIEQGGQIVDCIPIEQQQSFKGSAGPIVTAAPPPRSHESSPRVARRPTMAPSPQLHPDYRDPSGNQMWCPAGTIPMIRVTSRFRTLTDFLRVSPVGANAIETIDVPALLAERSIQIVGTQSSTVQGVRSILNIWKPVLGPNQTYSASGLALFGNPNQFIGCGLYIYPQLYGHDFPCVTVFYSNGVSSCYNRSCTGFVQTDPTFVVGAVTPSSPSISVTGGAQFDWEMTLFLKGGRWQFFLNNQLLGYYPASLFQGGDLATQARSFSFGGVTSGVGTWPPMGSGEYAAAGWGRAAYQRNIQWLGTPPSGDVAVDAFLSAYAPSPRCYSIVVNNGSGTSYASHIYFGGPGGTQC
jgi:hypothetical protein